MNFKLGAVIASLLSKVTRPSPWLSVPRRQPVKSQSSDTRNPYVTHEAQNLDNRRERAHNCGVGHVLNCGRGSEMRTSILGIIVSAGVGSFGFFGVASPVYAESVVVFGVGVWGPDVTPVEGFSEPGASFAFELELPNPIPSNPADGTDFDYILDTRGVIDEFLSPHVPVQFFTAAEAGLFDLFPQKNDDQGNPVVVSFYGPQIVFSQVIIPNDYSDVLAGMQSQPALDPTTGTPTGIADIRVSPLTVTGFGGGVAPGRGELLQLLGVPETSTWVMMTLGFAGLAFAGYRRLRKGAMAA